MMSKLILYMNDKFRIGRTAKVLFSIAIGIVSLLHLSGCTEDPPLTPDGRGSIEITALGDISLTNIAEYVPLVNAKAFVTSEYGVFEYQTDERGILKLEGLPSSVYNINIKMRHPDNPSLVITGNLLKIPITTNEIYTDTLFAAQIAGTGIAINEIYASGPSGNGIYFYDQFIELYNYSDETKYLDGMIMCRYSDSSPLNGPGSDEGNDGDIDGLTAAFEFPGNPGEKNYPFEARAFKVMAVLAINHKTQVSSSFDLSRANWEFYNQYGSVDFDNKNVPNIFNILPHKNHDFLISQINDCIILASGEDSNLADGLDVSTIIDGVQYRVDPTKRHTLDPRVDKSTIKSTSPYSGQSLQRREEGYDTNNGNLDWIIIGTPTPGRQ